MLKDVFAFLEKRFLEANKKPLQTIRNDTLDIHTLNNRQCKHRVADYIHKLTYDDTEIVLYNFSISNPDIFKHFHSIHREAITMPKDCK